MSLTCDKKNLKRLKWIRLGDIKTHNSFHKYHMKWTIHFRSYITMRAFISELWSRARWQRNLGLVRGHRNQASKTFWTVARQSCLARSINAQILLSANRIYHHVARGTRESRVSVAGLQSTTRLAESWMLQYNNFQPFLLLSKHITCTTFY